MNLRALPLLALLALAACGNKPEGGAAPTATVSAKPTPSAVAAVQTASAAPAVTAAPTAPSAAPEAEPAGAVHLHLDSVKVASGKNDGAEKALKGRMLLLRAACVGPALKKTPTFEGTLKVTLDVGADGKIEKAASKTVTGKLPDDLLQCVEGFFKDKVQLDPSKAKVEATLLMGPKVSPDH